MRNSFTSPSRRLCKCIPIIQTPENTGRVGGWLLGWVDFDLGSSPGWWATTVDTYCPSRMVEHPKSKSTNQVTNHYPHPVLDLDYEIAIISLNATAVAAAAAATNASRAAECKKRRSIAVSLTAAAVDATTIKGTKSLLIHHATTKGQLRRASGQTNSANQDQDSRGERKVVLHLITREGYAVTKRENTQ